MKFTTSKKGFTTAFALIALLAIAISAQAPQVTLRTLDGGSFNPASQRGKVIVLSFGATYVPMASKELPALQKLADRYSARGAEFYWVSVNSAKPGARYTATDAEIKDFA
ncbi:MAG TPA: redoxin domain-containing protein, partial [Blastocatellia bacterium]|nr:redoxin domain-containing protein [Blastocatellia bacterium]